MRKKVTAGKKGRIRVEWPRPVTRVPLERRLVPLRTLTGTQPPDTAPSPSKADIYGVPITTLDGGPQLPAPGDNLSPADIRKRFLSLRGRLERRMYLITAMQHFPIEVMQSGLLMPLFGSDGHISEYGRTLWLHRLAGHSNQARRAFDKLNKRQRKIILLVLPEERTIGEAASALNISRQHCHKLFWQAVENLFPDYKNARPRPTLRKLRELLAMAIEPETTWREQSGNSDDYLDRIAAGSGYDEPREEWYGQSEEDGE